MGSDHVPVIPIHSVDRFIVTETNENLGLEDEELQIYKTPKSDVYQLHRHRWEFFGKLDFRKTLLLALDGEAWLSGVRKYELLMAWCQKKSREKWKKCWPKAIPMRKLSNISLMMPLRRVGTWILLINSRSF